MRVSKNIRYTVRVRDYETVQVEVGAVADHHDLGWSDEDWAELKETRASWIDQLELLLITEVERLAREELETIAAWSEISPNLAEDFLSSATVPPAPIRSQHGTANKKTGSTPSSRRVRRTPGRTPPSPAA